MRKFRKYIPLFLITPLLFGQNIDYSRIRNGPGVSVIQFGAVGDGVHDDTIAIQAAIDSVRGVKTGGQYFCTNAVLFPAGNYKITSQINLYADAGYNGCHISGATGPLSTNIIWNGPSNQSAFRQIGQFVKIENLTIKANTDWLRGYSYDGQSGIGISTQSIFEHVQITCNGHKGDALVGGINNYQSDQLLLLNTYLFGCTYGRGLYMADANDVFYECVKCVIADNHIGYANVAGAYIDFNGGEIDNNDINFVPAIGSVVNVKGMRSEGSKRQTFNFGAGEAITNFTMISSAVDGWISARPITTAICTNGNSTITLSTPGYIEGDWIVLAGCGPASTNLTTEIDSLGSDLVTAVVASAPSTSQASAAVTLSNAVQQDQFILQNGGPYAFIGNSFQVSETGKTITFQGTSAYYPFVGWTFTNNTWGGVVVNPFGTHPFPTRLNMFGNQYDDNAIAGGPYAMGDYLSGNVLAKSRQSYYFSTQGGSNNAITISTVDPTWQPNEGDQIVVYLSNNSLQIGANTVTINGGVAHPILQSSNSANLGVGFAVNGMFTGILDAAGSFRAVGR
jgi:hypothetical protein